MDEEKQLVEEQVNALRSQHASEMESLRASLEAKSKSDLNRVINPPPKSKRLINVNYYVKLSFFFF